MFLKGYPLEAKTAPKNLNQSVNISWARLASFCHLGFISDPLIVSKFHNETHEPKGQENKIYNLRVTFQSHIEFVRKMQKSGDAFSKSSSIHNLPNYGEQFKKIIKRYKKVGHNVNINAWFKNQTRFIGLVFSIIARRWVRPPTQ